MELEICVVGKYALSSDQTCLQFMSVYSTPDSVNAYIIITSYNLSDNVSDMHEIQYMYGTFLDN
jgi:hypothetical protein